MAARRTNRPRARSKAEREFVSEAEEILERMRGDLLDLAEQRDAGREADPELVNRLFRSAHSLKGLSGMFGFDGMGELAHHLEDVLDRLRREMTEAATKLEFEKAARGTRPAVPDEYEFHRAERTLGFEMRPTRCDVDLGAIAHNVERKEKRLFTEREGGRKIQVYEASDDRDEAAWVVYDSARGNEFNVYIARVGTDGSVETHTVMHSPRYEGRATRHHGATQALDLAKDAKSFENIRASA